MTVKTSLQRTGFLLKCKCTLCTNQCFTKVGSKLSCWKTGLHMHTFMTFWSFRKTDVLLNKLLTYLPTYLLIYRAGLSQRGAPTLIPYFLHLPTPFPSPCIFPFPPLRLLSSSPSYLCGPIPLVQLRGLDSASSAGTGGAQPPNSVIHFKLKSAFGNSKFIQFFSAK